MPRDSNGNTSPLPGTIVTSGDTILPSQHNPALQDIYSMITQSLSRDGQGGMRAVLNLNGFRIANVGAATLPGDAVSLSQFQSASPVGAVIDFAGANAPDKWMLAYGQAISRTAYAEAFAVMGTRFGSGDGSTTFNLPDLRGRVVVGKDDMGGADSGRMTFFGVMARTIGGVFGAATHVLSTGEIPRHDHGGKTATGGEHDHMLPGGQLFGNGAQTTGQAPDGFAGQWFKNNSKTAVGGVHDHVIQNSGNDEAHNNTQPSIVMNKIIKVLY